MNHSISEYLTNIISTIFFTMALGFFILYLNLLSKANVNEMADQKEKASITMSSEYGIDNDYDDDGTIDHLAIDPYINGTDVFTDIISQCEKTPNVNIIVNRQTLSSDFKKDIANRDPSALNRLRDNYIVNLSGNFQISYIYTYSPSVNTNYRGKEVVGTLSNQLRTISYDII